MKKDYSKSGIEPTIAEVIDDPIIKLVMKSDGVSLGALLPLIEQAGVVLEAKGQTKSITAA